VDTTQREKLAVLATDYKQVSQLQRIIMRVLAYSNLLL